MYVNCKCLHSAIYEVPNVLVLPSCGVTLYSTRIMHSAHGFRHDVDAGRIHVPGAADIAIHDDDAVSSTLELPN